MIEPPGTQLWADVRWRDDWRVQRRWDAQVHRLLDPACRERHSGGLDACTRALDAACPAVEPAGHLVVLLHGLGRTRRSLMKIDAAVRSRGLSTARLDYPSTRKRIEDHAASVAEALDHLPVPRRLSFVTHSLGGLIVRQLHRYDAPWRAAFHRIVMIAPPNRGASIAHALDKGGVLRGVLGPSFGQIADGFAATLPVPDAPFAIYAGELRGAPGDGLVRVEETQLEGASEHHVVPALHTFVMNHPRVIRGCVTFLTGAPNGA